MARVKSVEGAELNLNIRDDADVGSVRPRDDTEEDAMSDEDQYDEDKLYSSGEKVWYKSSTGEMMKARVEEITADNELNLNIKEDAPWDRVTKRDDTQDGAMSDDDEYDHLDESSDEDSSDADDMDDTDDTDDTDDSGDSEDTDDTKDTDDSDDSDDAGDMDYADYTDYTNYHMRTIASPIVFRI